jgi:hypothetical protein
MDARQRPDRHLWALLGLMALAGCGAPSPDDGATGPGQVPAAPAPVAASGTPAAAPADAGGAGFTPLPSPEQVLAALPVGRPDPFAPVVAPAQAAGPAAGSPADALRLTGVLRSRYGPQAFVQLASGQSGAVCVGPRGRCPSSGLPPLLPVGWSVERIDVTQGRLLLNQAGQRRILSL